MGLGEVDQFTKSIREELSVATNPYNSTDYHPVSHILPSEHDRPPPRRDTRL
jgi:hypothetical protein